MSEWREFKIKEIGNVISGGTPKTSVPEYWNGTIAWITPKDLSNHMNKYISYGNRSITELGLEKSSARILPPGTILLTSRAPIGYIAIAENTITTNQGFKNIVCDNSKVNNHFLYYYLIANMDQIKGFASGATFPEISGKTLKNIRIRIPKLETQSKIASVLSTYDKLIENNNRRIQILEQTAEELYKEWFVRMRFPGYENTKFDKGIPEGWEVKKLNEFSELVQGYTEKANDHPVGPKYLRGTDINKKSYITWSEVPYCTINETNYKKHKLQIEDIVIIRMADPGKVAVIEDNVEAVFASYLIKINYDKSKVLPYYLFYTLYGKGYQSQIQSYANGTTRSSINSKMILNSSVLLPPKEIQMLFNERVLKYRKLLNQFINQNQNLIKQRDLLLPRLMNGTITVK